MADIESPIASGGNSFVDRRQDTFDKGQPPAYDVHVNNSKGLVNGQIFPEENDHVVSEQKGVLQKASTDKQHKDLVDGEEIVKNVSNDGESKNLINRQQETVENVPNNGENKNLVNRQQETVENVPNDGENKKLVDRQQETVENVPNDGENKNLVDRQQETVENVPNDGENKKLVDRQQETVENVPNDEENKNLVDRQQETVENVPNDGENKNLVDRQQETVENVPNNGENKNFVDRQQETVENVPNDGENKKLVDRQQETVENVPNDGENKNFVDRQQETVENVPNDGENKNFVDRQQETVENVPNDGENKKLVDRQQEIVENVPNNGENKNFVDRQQETVENVPNDGENKKLVDRQQETVENVPNDKSEVVVNQQQEISDVYPASNVNNIINQRNTKPALIRQDHVVQKPPHEVSQGLQTSSKNILVDQLKRGVEHLQDNKVTDAAGELAGRLDQCYVDPAKEAIKVTADEAGVDRRKSTVELDRQRPWTMVVHIKRMDNQGVLRGIPHEIQLFQWNTTVVFGRGEDVNIFLNDERISRNHLGLTGFLLPNGQACFSVTNLSNTKSILINDTELLPKLLKPIMVNTGDRIKVVTITFELEIIPGADTECFVLEFVLPNVWNQHNMEGGANKANTPLGHNSVYVPPLTSQQQVSIGQPDNGPMALHTGTQGMVPLGRTPGTNTAIPSGVHSNIMPLSVPVVVPEEEAPLKANPEIKPYTSEPVVPADMPHKLTSNIVPAKVSGMVERKTRTFRRARRSLVPAEIPREPNTSAAPTGVPGMVGLTTRTNQEAMPGMVTANVHVVAPTELNTGTTPPQLQRVSNTHGGDGSFHHPNVSQSVAVNHGTSLQTDGVIGPSLAEHLLQNLKHIPYQRGNLNYTHDTLKLYDNLRFLAGEVVSKWKPFGRALSLEEHNLTIIDLNNPEHYEKSYQMLLTWFYINASNCAAKNSELLHKALCDITVGRDDLAGKYCPQNREDEPHGNNGDEDDGDDSDSNGDT